MSFISQLKSNYTEKRANKIKELEMSVNNENGAIKSNDLSPEIISVEKKVSLKSTLTLMSIGKNIEHTFKSLKNNPDFPKTSASNEFIQEFENYAISMNIKSIGYTKVPQEVIFKDKALLYENAIVFTKEIDKNSVDNELPGKAATDLKLYDELGKKTNELADYLRKNGFGAHASHPAIGLVTYPVLAQYAGLGWKGKSNLLITPESGPRQKISAIFTSIENLPFNEDKGHSWIEDYCDTCGKCIKKCPEDAMIEIESADGSKRNKIIAEICRGCNESCTICMKECPFNKRDYTSLKNRFEKNNKGKKNFLN
ncbi:4Fe-4S binding protein [Methanobacterium oryzae]|uniref:4Fe-4S binding protein n=1 Tax=Methanobacterium oryzae TaxID=69540 RepID=UPI003D1D99E6